MTVRIITERNDRNKIILRGGLCHFCHEKITKYPFVSKKSLGGKHGWKRQKTFYYHYRCSIEVGLDVPVQESVKTLLPV